MEISIYTCCNMHIAVEEEKELLVSYIKNHLHQVRNFCLVIPRILTACNDVCLRLYVYVYVCT